MKQPPYPAPEFSLKDENGAVRTLAEFGGKWLVLYFYPKDDTPGCTVEACSLRDVRDDLVEMGVEVVGVSKDSVHSHDAFKAKYTLNFTLLSDPSGEVADAYGALSKKLLGAVGIVQRKTFIIDPEGVVRRVYDQVVPAGHGDALVGDIKALMAS